MRKLILTICLLSTVGCASNKAAPVFNLAEEPSEESIFSANVAYKQLRLACPVVKKTKLTAKIASLFDSLASSQNVSDLPRPVVLKCPEASTVSFPAIRQVVLYEGLTKLDLSDEELSFVLAHEMAHLLQLPEDLARNEALRKETILQRSYILEKNCESDPLKSRSIPRQQVAKKCQTDANLWITQEQTLGSQQSEEFYDKVALEVLKQMGVDGSVAVSALNKISEKESLNEPASEELVKKGWLDTFTGHLPAWKRLQYLDPHSVDQR